MLHFVTPDAGSAQSGDVIRLTGKEAHHAATVRRLRVGESVTLGDGRGVWLTGECTAVAAKEVSIAVRDRVDLPSPSPRIVLVQALAKGDRDELAVQAATELGVDVVIPWQAARSVSRWDVAKAEKGRTRWSTITREAAKQAHRAWIPEVLAVVSTKDLMARAATARILVLDPTATTSLSAVDVSREDIRDVVLIVGPEGGIAPEELGALESAGAERVRLGTEVLRTSTAGPAALAVASVLLGRW